MIQTTACRRRHRRFILPDDGSASIRFGYPRPNATAFAMPLRDISACGLSFVLDREYPGLEVGLTIERTRVTVGGAVLEGDLLVMRLSPDASRGSTCGGLFFPDGDENILAMQRLIDELDRSAD